MDRDSANGRVGFSTCNAQSSSFHLSNVVDVTSNEEIDEPGCGWRDNGGKCQSFAQVREDCEVSRACHVAWHSSTSPAKVAVEEKAYKDEIDEWLEQRHAEKLNRVMERRAKRRELSKLEQAAKADLATHHEDDGRLFEDLCPLPEEPFGVYPVHPNTSAPYSCQLGPSLASTECSSRSTSSAFHVSPEPLDVTMKTSPQPCGLPTASMLDPKRPGAILTIAENTCSSRHRHVDGLEHGAIGVAILAGSAVPASQEPSDAAGAPTNRA
mmetsp:Transcript_123308/g.310377  ORF Transcript_123308/g.310377 Transcript_123308/m.310377 type:complete len:268 (-) Transcript_123308:235-1038(-)